MLGFIIILVITYFVCKGLDNLGEFLDYDYPAIEERRYKEKVLKKYGPEIAEDERRIFM